MEVVSDENDGGKSAAAEQAAEEVATRDNPSEPPAAGPGVASNRSYGSSGAAVRNERKERMASAGSSAAEVEETYDDPSTREPVAHRSFFSAFIDDFDFSDLR
mmetsp:Transcript_31833/g.46409  ORF Transcript_31833/g.46409 Transcript_31833/m.46409 type:complete len:103 (+) Transcript_31833:124-432(+)